MLVAPHLALNQLISVMLGMALTVSNMTNAWQEQHLLILHVTTNADAKVVPGATHATDTRSVRRNDPATRDRDLILAVQAGNTVTIQSLLAEGASLKVRDADSRTALIAAVVAHMNAAARLLIQAGADVNLRNNTQSSVFLLTAGQDDMETVRLTLPHGANLRATNVDGDTTLIPATRRDYVETVSELMKTGAPPDAANNLGLTALTKTVTLGGGSDEYKKTIQVLLGGGAGPNLADRGGVTLVRHTRQRGFHGIGALLFKVRGH